MPGDVAAIPMPAYWRRMYKERLTKMEWDGEKQAGLEALWAAELGSTQDEAGEAQLKALLE